ncbi:MAG: aminoglycoside phosphotransferase family protein [Nocardioides sp.]
MPVDLWTAPSFVEEATAWSAAAAAEHGLALTGEWEQPHARPWSSAIRLETDGGRLWFKVNGPGTAHEAALTGVLAAVVPDLVPEVLALDAGRGWSLMRDAGPVLRSVAEADRRWDHWHTVVAAYARGQRGLADHRGALLDTGASEVSPATLPQLARDLLEKLAARPVEDGGLDRDQAARLAALLPAYDGWCAELAASGVPASVNHDDLHDGNICWNGGGPRIIDWGDAVLGHPFGTLLTTLNSIAWQAGCEIDDPRVVAVRDAYLDEFADVGSPDDRARWTLLARRTGCVSRALSYVRAFEGEDDAAEAAEDWPVRAWFLELLEDAD